MEEIGLQDLLWGIESVGWKVTDPRIDGYSQFEHKKKLYAVLWKVQDQLHKCSTFYGEDQWLQNHAEDVIIAKLNGN
jgi:hypothetical protein